MSAEKKDNFKGKTGEKNDFTVFNDYPYVILSPPDFEYDPKDVFILSSTDNSYSKEVDYSQIQKDDGLLIVWFPMPPKGKKYSLKIKFHKPTEENPLKEYILFEDEILTLRDDEKASEEHLYIRGGN